MDTKVLILARNWIEDPSLLHDKPMNQLIIEDYQQPHTAIMQPLMPYHFSFEILLNKQHILTFDVTTSWQ